MALSLDTQPNFRKHAKLITFICAVFFTGATYANPEGGSVVAGDASIQQSSGSTVIQQNSQQAIVNWQSFNIGANESTHFQQPAGGVILNRINPQQGASQIYGQLTSTGRVILVNQAGIYFGASARVDVGGIIASTSDISNQNFLAGKYIFDQPSTYAGSVVNEGVIRAANNGLVALVGSAVRNDGTIQANLGNVVLASGNKFTIDMSGDSLINFTIDEETATAGQSPVDGKKLTSGVSNTGSVIADGGRIIMTARAAAGVLDNVINMSGIAQAHSVSQNGGVIILSAGPAGKVSVSGKIDASGKTSGSKGGDIKILGHQVELLASAIIDASGDLGGGNILIGGNFHGAGPEQNAAITNIASGVSIFADAITQGNGGKVAVWSDDATEFHGLIRAQGGALSGDGGFIETSGHYLNTSGAKIYAGAVNGKRGTWLLDPVTLDIIAGGLGTSTATASGVPTNQYTSPGSTLTDADLENALASSDVVVTTTGGDLSLDVAINYTSGLLTLESTTDNVLINASINSTTQSAASLVVNAPLGQITFGGGSAIVIGQGGGQQYNAPIVLNQDVTMRGVSSGTGIQFASTVNGPNALVVSNDATTQFGGNVGTLTSLSSLSISGLASATGGQLSIPSAIAVLTAGDQTYNSPVSIGGGLSITTISGNVSINSGLSETSAGQTLEINEVGSNLLSLAGAFNIANVNLTGNNGSLIVATSSPTQTWSLTTTGGGSISGVASSSFSFSGMNTIQGGSTTDNFNFASGLSFGTVTGGSGTNNFNFSGSTTATVNGGAGANNYVFADGSQFSGTFTGGGTSNVLNFSAFAAPVTLTFGSSSTLGAVTNNLGSTVVSFTGFSAGAQMLGDSTGRSSVFFPTSTTGKKNVVTMTLASAGQGVIASINDPFVVSGFNSFTGQLGGIDEIIFSGFSPSSFGSGTINGVPMQFSNVVFPQSASIVAIDNALKAVAISGTATTMSTTSDTSSTALDTVILPMALAVNENIQSIQKEFDTSIPTAKFSLHCSTR